MATERYGRLRRLAPPTDVLRESLPAAENPLHGITPADRFWTTTNIAEAVPGVSTPLGWSLWGAALEQALRSSFFAIGALPRELNRPAGRAEAAINIFYGRPAINVNFFCNMGDRIPGTSAEAVARQLLGSTLPAEMKHGPCRQRYPVVAARFPLTLMTAAKPLRTCRMETQEFWRSSVAEVPALGLAEARAHLAAAVRRFDTNVITHGILNLGCVQPVFDLLQKLIHAGGGDPDALMAGHGSHEESALVQALWAVSRDGLSLEDFLAVHGYHGPNEGAISATVWREDPTPLLATIAGYRSLGEASDPAIAERERAEARDRAEHELLDRLPRTKRPQARLILRLASQRLPLRGVGKVAFLQALDVVRVTARRLGTLLADNDTLEAPDDVFFLTAEELMYALPANVLPLVRERREHYQEYLKCQVPNAWQGIPDQIPTSSSRAEQESVLQGLGASGGVVEGMVRVVNDPSSIDMDPGDILVAHTTDPSWAAVMLLSSALVVDIGGLLSHAAVVARELGIPCVMGTEVGTQVLRSGDRCRIDGSAGTVQLLERVQTPGD